MDFVGMRVFLCSLSARNAFSLNYKKTILCNQQSIHMHRFPSVAVNRGFTIRLDNGEHRPAIDSHQTKSSYRQLFYSSTTSPARSYGLAILGCLVTSSLFGIIVQWKKRVTPMLASQKEPLGSSLWVQSISLLGFPVLHAAKPFEDHPNKSSEKRTTGRFNFIADVVEGAAPAVVNIEIQGRDPFTGRNVPVSNGSGFIVGEDGLILTNAHVVAHRASVLVKLHDGRSFEGTVHDVDYVSDLATVRINCKALPTLKLGSSADLRPGEFVVAMGSPLSLSNTITAGVVSSVHRESSELGLGHKKMEYIQTDASITFGNSGGPLVNLDGEVIGINSMKVTAGISFAIPADYAKEFLENSKKKKGAWFGDKSTGGDRNKRRYIGVTMLTLTPSIVLELQQRQADFPPGITNGVFIWRIVIGSPAHTGGLQPGDIVVGINGGDVKTANDVYRVLESSTELRLVVMRRNKKLALTVVPED